MNRTRSFIVVSLLFGTLLCMVQAGPPASAVNWNGDTTGCAAGVDTTYLTQTYWPYEVPQPTTSIVYNAGTQTVDMTVTAKYLPQDTAYVIRFEPFSWSQDDI